MAVKDEQGRWIDGKGDAIPVKYIDPIDKKRDRMVNRLVKKATDISGRLSDLSEQIDAETEKFMNEAEAKYDMKIRTEKGNKQFTDFSNTMKIELKMANFIDFDERLQMAKSLIDECIKKWSGESDDKIRILVEHAFKVDKKGNLDKRRILGLKNLRIKDDDWKKAMKLIGESVTVVSRKRYVKFSVKDDKGNWVHVPLDISDV